MIKTFRNKNEKIISLLMEFLVESIEYCEKEYELTEYIRESEFYENLF